MASGVNVPDACKDIFTEMKTRKNLRYLIYKITDDLSIAVDEAGDRDKTYEDFTKSLIAAQNNGECRYGVFDLEYSGQVEGAGQTKKDKLVFFMWSPDTCKIKQKMLYASSKDALKKKLEGGGGFKMIQANDAGDLELESVLEKVSRLDRS